MAVGLIETREKKINVAVGGISLLKVIEDPIYLSCPSAVGSLHAGIRQEVRKKSLERRNRPIQIGGRPEIVIHRTRPSRLSDQLGDGGGMMLRV